MPKFYCDYCATFLTHDSKSVRQSHINGWKHKASVKNWYEQFMANESQEVINQRIKAFEARMALLQGACRSPPFAFSSLSSRLGPAPRLSFFRLFICIYYSICHCNYVLHKF